MRKLKSRAEDDGDVETGGKGGTGSPGRKNRHRPFAAVLMVGWLVTPVLTFPLRILGAFDVSTITLSVWLISGLVGLALPGMALGIGYKVTKRFPFIIWHVVFTLEAFALWWSLSISLSWESLGRGLGYRLIDAVALPVAWWVVGFIAPAALAGSWLLYRIDAFRSATKTGEGAKGETLEAYLGLPDGAKVNRETITVDEHAVELEIEHEGIPVSQVRGSVQVVNELPGIIPGKTTVVREGETGGRSKMRAVHTDPYKQWWEWPGLSHPGGIYEAPINTARYSDGSPQWYSFAKTPDGMTFAKAPGFASPSGTFKGANGITGSGKSGDADIENAEVLSRQWTIFVYIDAAKLRQNAGWCLDLVNLAAGTGDHAALLIRKLMKLSEHRGKQIDARDFSTEIAKRTGRPWIHVFIDEADLIRQGSDFKYLATKARSTGIRFSLIVPRAVGDQLDPTIRGAIGMWKQFGLSQGYDAGFAMSSETLEQGADPTQWGSTVPGAHYLDKAPGVPPARYAMDARSYKTREDRSELRAAVIKAREGFTPFQLADLPADEREILGEVIQLCDPRRALIGTNRPESSKDAAPDMQKTQPLEDLLAEVDGRDDLDDDLIEPITTGDDMIDEALANAPSPEFSHLGVDPRQPVPQMAAGQTGETLAGPNDKPRVSPAEVSAEFEAALFRMADKGVTEFGNKDVIAEMRVHTSGGAMSKRMSELCEGDHATVGNPPRTLTLSRIPNARGRYALVRM